MNNAELNRANAPSSATLIVWALVALVTGVVAYEIMLSVQAQSSDTIVFFLAMIFVFVFMATAKAFTDDPAVAAYLVGGFFLLSYLILVGSLMGLAVSSYKTCIDQSLRRIGVALIILVLPALIFVID